MSSTSGLDASSGKVENTRIGCWLHDNTRVRRRFDWTLRVEIDSNISPSIISFRKKFRWHLDGISTIVILSRLVRVLKSIRKSSEMRNNLIHQVCRIVDKAAHVRHITDKSSRSSDKVCAPLRPPSG